MTAHIPKGHQIDDTHIERVHLSFRTKPKSELQLQSQACKFQDNKLMDRTCAPDPYTYFQRNVMPAEVPTTWENKYDPQHPSADWAGLVPSNEYGRKHFESHASMRSGIKQAEEGIVSQVEKQEWSKKDVISLMIQLILVLLHQDQNCRDIMIMNPKKMVEQ